MLLTDDQLRGEQAGGLDLVGQRERSVVDIIRALWRWKWLVLGVIAVPVALAFVAIAIIPPQYTANAVIQLDTRRTELPGFSSVVSDLTPDELSLQSEMHVISSYAIAAKVADRLKLVEDPEFNPLLQESSPWGDLVGLAATRLQAKLLGGESRESVGAVRDDASEMDLEGREPAGAGDEQRNRMVLTTEQVPEALLEDGTAQRDDAATDASALAVGAEGGGTAVDPSSRAVVVETILNRLSVWNEGRSYTIFVDFTSLDPAKAAAIANEFVDQYMQNQLDTARRTTEQVSAWLGQRLVEARAQVAQAEAAVQEFQAEHPQINLSADGTHVTAQQLNEINQTLAEAGAERAALEARLERAREQLSSGAASAIPEVVASPLVQRLRAEAAALERQRAEMASVYGENHPTMQALQAEANDLRREIGAASNNIVSALEAEVEAATAREEKLRAQMDELQGKVGVVDRLAAQFRELERDVDASRAHVRSLTERYEQTVAVRDAQEADAHLVAPAAAPLKPSAPNKVAILGSTFIASTGLALILVLLFEYFDRGFRTTAQIERAIGLPCLGMIPQLSRRNVRRLRRRHDDLPQIFVEAIRRIRTAVQAGNGGERPRVVLVTSSVPEEGKSSFAVALARSYAEAGLRTLLIDGDLHRPSIAKVVGLGKAANSDADESVIGIPKLADPMTEGRLRILLLADASRRVEHDRQRALTFQSPAVADMIRAAATAADVGLATDARNRGRVPGDHDARAGARGPAVADVIRAAAKDAEVVVVDAPPVMLLADALVFAPLADAVLYIVRWGHTPREAVVDGLARLRNASARVAGVVLSRVDLARHKQYGYRDEGYYSKRYSRYYMRPQRLFSS